MKRSRSKSRTNKSNRCKRLLRAKIAVNMREQRYSSRAQAIAVAYAQTRKRHPSCRRVLSKRSKRRTSRRRTSSSRGQRRR